MSIVNSGNKFNCEIAYMVYSHAYDNWSNLSDKEQKKARRQVESTLRESGFNGNPTGLISEAALETVVNQKKGIQPTKMTRTALEHPITYTNVAMHCLSQPTKLSFDDYFKVWADNLVTTITTNEENQRLRSYQSDFNFGVDCWKEMYENAGIKLVEKPILRTNEVKRQYGIL